MRGSEFAEYMLPSAIVEGDIAIQLRTSNSIEGVRTMDGLIGKVADKALDKALSKAVPLLDLFFSEEDKRGFCAAFSRGI